MLAHFLFHAQGSSQQEHVYIAMGDCQPMNLFHRATWHFRDRFDAVGLPGYRHDREGGPKYYRVFESLNTCGTEDAERMLAVLGDGVLANTAVRVVVEGELRPGMSVFRFIQTLRKRSHLHFV